jgi:pimeloyl-[acyl-carrier protein] methyl ester esterase
MADLINYHIKGSGRPLVLIHGWAMHAGVWQGFSDQLAKHCMVIEVDLRGHGASRAMGGPHTFEQYARDVTALLKHLDLRDAALLGWSMGASIILKMFAQGYQGTGALVLISGNPSLIQRDNYESGLAPVIIKRLIRQVQRDYTKGLSTFLNLLCTAEEHERFSTDAAYQSAMDTAACPDPEEVALSTLACLQDEDLRSAVGHITAPTLIVHGECDEICLSSGGRYLNNTLPNAQMLILPDTGHMPFITRRERVVEAVLNFLPGVA